MLDFLITSSLHFVVVVMVMVVVVVMVMVVVVVRVVMMVEVPRQVARGGATPAESETF